MLYFLGLLLIILLCFFYLREVKEEGFENRNYVMPKTDIAVTYSTPDMDWKEMEESVAVHMKKEGDAEEVASDVVGDAEEVASDVVGDAEEVASDVVGDAEEVAREASSMFSDLYGSVKGFLYGVEKEASALIPSFEQKHDLKTDQRYILQKQKSAPRYLPKFSNTQIRVYEPKKPKLHYATRPGPNSFHDSLTEREHVATEKELKAEWRAQKNAQERHNDLLRRQNWVFQSVNDITPDYILKKPKIIPGPSNSWKYSCFTHYGKA